MLVEPETAIHLDENEDLLATYVGGIWSDFKSQIPEHQSNILVSGFNLIIISSIPEFELEPDQNTDYLPNSIVLTTIPTILLDETQDISGKKEVILLLLINNIIELLEDLGVKLEEDYLNIESVEHLILMLDFFFSLEDYEDLIGLRELFTSLDIAPKERFIEAMTLYHGENEDLDPLNYMIDDVSEVTINALNDSLKRVFGDQEDLVPESLKQRVINNKPLFQDNFVADHIKDGGELGSPLRSLLNFFSTELGILIDNPTKDNMIQYTKSLVMLNLISDENDSAIRENCLSQIIELSDDLSTYGICEDIINQVVLEHE